MNRFLAKKNSFIIARVLIINYFYKVSFLHCYFATIYEQFSKFELSKENV
jgi:hypothetical protein